MKERNDVELKKYEPPQMEVVDAGLRCKLLEGSTEIEDDY